MNRKSEYLMKEVERQQLKDMEEEYQEQILDDEQEMANIQHSQLSRKSKSRIRHHNSERAKRRAKNSAAYLSSKLDKLPLNATVEEESRLFARTIAAEKKAARLH